MASPRLLDRMRARELRVFLGGVRELAVVDVENLDLVLGEVLD
jgi:hypothetical protein